MVKPFLRFVFSSCILTLNSCQVNDSESIELMSSASLSSIMASSESSIHLSSKDSAISIQSIEYEIGYQWIYKYLGGLGSANEPFSWNDTITIIEKYEEGDSLIYVRRSTGGAAVWKGKKNGFRDLLIVSEGKVLKSPLVVGPDAWAELDMFESLDSKIIWEFDSERLVFKSQSEVVGDEKGVSVLDTSMTDVYKKSESSLGSHYVGGLYSNKFGIISGGGADAETGAFEYRLLEVNFFKEDFEAVNNWIVDSKREGWKSF